MIRSRKILISLAPLLDLLLLLMFAQNIQLRERAKSQIKQVDLRSEAFESETIVLREKLQSQQALLQERSLTIQSLEREMVQIVANQNQERQQLEEQITSAIEKLKEENEARETLAELAQKLRIQKEAVEADAARTLDQLSRVVRGIFSSIPQETFEQLLDQLADPQQQSQLQETLQQMRGPLAGAILSHLRRVNELKKRSDVWELHIDTNEVMTIRVEGRLLPDKIRFRNAEEFQSRLMRAVRPLEDPNDLILLMLSYSNPRERMLDVAKQALDSTVEQLEEHYGRRKRVEWADLGARLESP